MNADETSLAWQIFKAKIFQLDGTAFQDFFVHVMRLGDKNFSPIKPQGPKGF